MLPYYLGCSSWNEAGWRNLLYARSTQPSDFLSEYCRFNAVEGNTTFYAPPAAETVQRWGAFMPEGFRFCAKIPREISHEGDLRDRLAATHDFLTLLKPLGMPCGSGGATSRLLRPRRGRAAAEPAVA